MEMIETKKRARLSYVGKNTVSSFMEVNIASLKRAGRLRTSEAYTATLSSFMRFMNGKEIVFRRMDADLMAAYEGYLRRNGVAKNSTSFYMRILRAVYNRAVDKGFTRQRRPFRLVYTGIDKTVKRAVSFEVIKLIKDLDVGTSQSLAFARDMFLFSFYTRGMSFVDMAYLKKKDLDNGILSYRRKKTGQRLSIKWEGCMQEIVDRHPRFGSPYLLPIIGNIAKEERKQYKNSLCLVNRRLKIIGDMLKLSHPLTMYVARHSWASIAKEKNIPISVISESMGHDSERTTLIYLATLDNALIDDANRAILHDLM